MANSDVLLERGLTFKTHLAPGKGGLKPKDFRGGRHLWMAPNDKKDYRPVTILSNISEKYERLLYKKLETYSKSILSQYQCGFRKGFSVLASLLPMIEKWRDSFDSGGNFGALLTDLSKAFDCLSYNSLLAKLHAYGLGIPSLKLLHSYLIKRRQRVKINNTDNSWSEILVGVPQGFILGPLLFNIFFV